MTFCSAVTACETTRVAVPIRPAAERLACEGLSARPVIPPEYVIDWSKVATVSQARAEHDRFVATIRNREGIIAGHIIATEGRLFACSNNAKWLRDFYAALPAQEE